MSESEFSDFSSSEDWFNLTMCLLCILCAGLAAGLTIGLISVDKNELRLLAINGTEEEKRQANKVMPLIKDHHWLLVTLFLFNATANEALPIFLSSLVPEYAAVILATFSVLIFGEILPSSIFSGPKQLQIAASFSGVVRFLMFIFYIIARPIGLLLDHWLGKHEEEDAPFYATDLYTLLSLGRQDNNDKSLYNPIRTPLLTKSNSNTNGYGSPTRDPQLQPNADANIHNTNGSGSEHDHDHVHRAPAILRNYDNSDNNDNLLNNDSIAIAQGAILCSREYVEQIVQKTYHHVNANEIVNIDFFQQLGHCGYSRILVKEHDTLLGYIIVKELLSDIKNYLNIDVKEPTTTYVKELPLHSVRYFANDTTVLDALNVMQCGFSRIAAVTTDGTCNGQLIGYFSLEDIVEEIIQEEVSDEKDTSTYNTKSAKNTTKVLQRNNSYRWLKNKHLERKSGTSTKLVVDSDINVDDIV